MADNFKYAQLQPYSIYGAGATIGDTTLTLQSMEDIAGNALTMATHFGTIGFGTIDPGNGTLEEQICFTGLTNNSNGTTTLTGVSNVSFLYPYTKTSGLAQTHASSVDFVISNTSGFYDSLTAKDDDETIVGTWVFPSADTAARAGIGSDVDTTTATAFVTLGQLSRQAISGASNASTTVKGIVQLPTQAQVDARTTTGSTSALLALTPDKQRSTLLSNYQADTGSANFIVIAPSPAVTSYQAGQIFSTKVIATNTSPSVSVNVSGLGAKSLILTNLVSPSVGDLVAGQVITVEYDGTNFQMQSPPVTSISATPTGSMMMYGGSTAPTNWLICNGSPFSRTTYSSLFAVISTTYGAGDASTTFNVPDMRGRIPVGVGTGTGGGASGTGLPSGGTALTTYARGSWQGEETHVLSTAEMPAHVHSIGISQGPASPGGSGTLLVTGGSINTGSTGGDGAHNNLQPLMGLNYIIHI